LSQSIQLKQCNLLTCNCVVKDGFKKIILIWLRRPKIGYPIFHWWFINFTLCKYFLDCYLGYTPQFQRSPFLWLHVDDLGWDWGQYPAFWCLFVTWMLPKIWKVNEDHRCWPLLTYLHIFSWRIRFESVQIIESCWEWISLRNHDLSH
jgi:hypothetical protein